jgi:hypothetical protein
MTTVLVVLGMVAVRLLIPAALLLLIGTHLNDKVMVT